MESRVETLLNALVNGETIDFNPQSRMEEYLKNCINKSGTEGLPAPQSRVDALLYKLAEAIASGGGGSSTPTTPTATDNRTHLSYWYQSLAAQYNWQVGYDIENDTEIYYLELLEELEYPKGTQNVKSLYMFASAYVDWDGGYGTVGVPTKKFIGTLDIPNATDLSQMFFSCHHLTDIGDVRYGPNVSDCGSMFNGCEKITSLSSSSLPDMRTVTSVAYMFSRCYELVTLPELDLRSAVYLGSIVQSAGKLQNVRLKNIKSNAQIGSGSVYGHLIVVDDLIFMIYHLRNAGAARTFTIGSANLAKLADVYVKTIDITDEMRAEDDLIDEKLPFVVCESTDEGAMLIKDYVSLKNWTLK